MLGPLAQGTIDAALVAEPYRTMALQQGSKHIAYPFTAVCSKRCLLTFWVARADVDQNVAARFRNAIQAAAVWANQRKNDEASGKIVAKYVPIDAAVLKKMTRTRFAERLRPSLAQPWLDAFAKRGLIPAGFKASELVK
jgi:ABC-type nitrate/sulfonate/bicarbonate transport system substrate-binding protein